MAILDEEINDLIDGRLNLERVGEIQAESKDADRRARVIAAWQSRLGWKDPIVLCLQESLFIVQRGTERIVRCACGHDFCEYRTNWKNHALVYERDPQDGQVYAPESAPASEWMVLREFYCPSCATQLDAEGVPKGYPFIFNFLPFFPDDAGSA
jgi:acetone carboxylase, gamma subunit